MGTMQEEPCRATISFKPCGLGPTDSQNRIVMAPRDSLFLLNAVEIVDQIDNTRPYIRFLIIRWYT